MNVTQEASGYVRQIIGAWPAQPDQHALNDLLRLLGRWRSLMLASTYISMEGGARIWGGPFAGMDYVRKATEGGLIARLLGTYESELHPHLAAFAAEGVDCVIDVGCAEGYYAVGLARMMPSVDVHAYDIDPKARAACADLAARNGVAERVTVGSEFRADGFEAFAGRRVLVMIDIEGAEVALLRPDLSPSLAQMSLIVETHDGIRPGAMAAMRERFAPTHDIVEVKTGPKILEGPPWLLDYNHLDQLLAVWEWRATPTPWLIMRPKRA